MRDVNHTRNRYDCDTIHQLNIFVSIFSLYPYRFFPLLDFFLHGDSIHPIAFSCHFSSRIDERLPVIHAERYTGPLTSPELKETRTNE